MGNLYKVNIYSSDLDLSNYMTEIIVKRMFIFAKEIITGEWIMICDNKTQGSMYYYYVLSEDFKQENIVRYDFVNQYLDDFEYRKFPFCSKKEKRQIAQLIKKKVIHTGFKNAEKREYEL